MLIYTTKDNTQYELDEIYNIVVTTEPMDDDIIYYRDLLPNKTKTAVYEHIPEMQLIELDAVKPILVACRIVTPIDKTSIKTTPYRHQIRIKLLRPILVEYVVGNDYIDDVINIAIELPENFEINAAESDINDMIDIKCILAIASAKLADDSILTEAIALASL